MQNGDYMEKFNKRCPYCGKIMEMEKLKKYQSIGLAQLIYLAY